MLKCASTILGTTSGAILDVPSGSGRNSLVLAEKGAHLLCIDNDPDQLRRLAHNAKQLGLADRVEIQLADLLESNNPFATRIFSCILNFDWPEAKLFEVFISRLQPGGLLCVETFANRGENWRCLPKANFYKENLERYFDFEIFEECKAGPATIDAVTVKLLARRTFKKIMST